MHLHQEARRSFSLFVPGKPRFRNRAEQETTFVVVLKTTESVPVSLAAKVAVWLFLRCIRPGCQFSDFRKAEYVADTDGVSEVAPKARHDLGCR